MKVFQGIVDAYLQGYEIKKKDSEESLMYFKETEKKEMLANCVFEMADFARTFLSAIGIGAANAQEPDVLKEKFERDAKKYLKQNYKQKEQVQFHVPIGHEGRQKKVSAVIYARQKLNPVQFLSGGNFYYYKSNVNNAHQDYALLGDFDLIDQKLALYDDTSEVYK